MAADPAAATNEYVQELDRRVLRNWLPQNGPAMLPIAGGKGSRVWDHEGHEYLDFSCQLVYTNLGHQHPAVLAAITEQTRQIVSAGPTVANLARGLAAERITALAPEGFDKVYFTNGGADAVENAVRMARLHTGREKVLSTYRSYHGHTTAAVTATGDWRRAAAGEYARGHVHFFGPYLYRSEFWATTPEEESERALRHLARVLECEGPSTVAAVLLETVPGTAGILVPPPGYLAGVRELCDKHGVLLILDEVMAGFGRTGHWFAFDAFHVKPDLVTFAKGVNSGYVPAGGVILSEPVAATFEDRLYPGGLTYSGHPLAMAAIVGTLDAMREEKVVEHAARIGAEVIAPAMKALAEEHRCVGETRGSGVFWAVELVADRATREPLPTAAMAQVRQGLIDRGLLPMVVENRIHVVPPCVVTPDEVAEGFAIIHSALAEL